MKGLMGLKERKLYRSDDEKMVAGVSGGLAEFFGVDVTVMRLLFVVLALMGGVGLVIYIACWLIVPQEPASRTQQLLLVEEEERGEAAAPPSDKGDATVDKRLYRSRSQRILGGVCGGLAEYFEIDVVIIRLVFVLLLFVNIPAVLGYIIAWIIIPERKVAPRSAEMEGEYGPAEEVPAHSNAASGLWLGYILVALGAFLLLRTWLPYTLRMAGLWQYRFMAAQWWPLFLILLGVAFLFSGRGRSSS